MSSKRTIFIEAAIVIGFLGTGLVAADAAHAAQASSAVQATADARANVKIESKIQVERSEEDADGKIVVKYYNPADVKVIPGDKLIFINSYKNTGNEAVSGFVVNNPVHSAVEFTSVDEDWAELSVDDGVNFSDLETTSILSAVPADNSTANQDTAAVNTAEEKANVQTTRPATPADVTNIRWLFKEPIAPGSSGELTFRGVVK